MAVALYIRVSSQEQANEGYSVGEQEERLKSYCRAVSWTVYKVYIDPGFTGSNIKRPGLQELLRDAAAHRFDRVVVYKLDRLSRSQKDTLELIEDRFLKNGIDFVSISENFDTSTPFGRAMIGILAVFAQLEREQIKERMQMGKMARAKEGKWCGGGVPPFGYNYINDQLVPDDIQKLHVMEMFNLAERGTSPAKISEIFSRKGYKCNMTAERWTDTMVRRMLKNDVYIGKVSYFKQKFDGIHEPLISQEQFDNVQAILQQRTEQYERLYPDPNNKVTYFGGYLVCAKCGAKYQHRTAKKNYKGHTYSYNYYTCNSVAKKNPNYIRDPNCTNITWKQKDLEESIFNEMKKLTVEQVDDHFTLRPDDIQKKTYQAEIKAIDRKMERLMDLYIMDGVPKDKVQVQIHDLNKRRDQITEQMEAIQEPDTEAIKDCIKTIPDILAHGSYADIRDLISQLIDHVEIDGEYLTIVWKF